MLNIKHHIKIFLKVLLLPLKARIRSGPMKGLRWSISSGSRFIRGTFETEKTQAITETVKPGNIVYDIGAHVGYFSILMARLVGNEGHVYSFEPRPLTHMFLKSHIKGNHVDNITVTYACVGDKAGTVQFETRTGTGTSHISEEGNISREMVVLDQLHDQGKIPAPDFVKIDVEGAEMMVLRGIDRILDKYHPTMIVATHGDEIHHEAMEFLKNKGYEFTDIDQPKGDVETLARYPK